MAHLKLTLLGSFHATLDDAPLTGFAYNKVRALLAYLVLERDWPHTRAHLAALLWPDVPERVARQSLSVALATLRTALGDRDASDETRGIGVPFVLVTAHHVQLNSAAMCSVDVWKFSALLAKTDAHHHYAWHTCAVCAQHLRHAVRLYCGDLLAQVRVPDSEMFEEWRQIASGLLHQRVLGACDHLIDRAEWRGAFHAAIRYAGWQCAHAPLHEANQRTLMRLLALNQQRDRALDVYTSLVEALILAGHAAPEQETRMLREQISVLTPAMRGTLRRFGPPPGHIPKVPAPARACHEDVDAICTLLRTQERRLLTITGPLSSSAKTWIASQVAQMLRFDFADGVYYINLATQGAPMHLLCAIADAMGVTVNAEQHSMAVFVTHLEAQHILLVVDGCEYADDVAHTLAMVLSACPAIVVVATSHMPLHIRAEQQYPVCE